MAALEASVDAAVLADLPSNPNPNPDPDPNPDPNPNPSKPQPSPLTFHPHQVLADLPSHFARGDAVQARVFSLTPLTLPLPLTPTLALPPTLA